MENTIYYATHFLPVREQYRKLRHEYRNQRRQLLSNSAAFERCLVLNSYARNLTGQWQTGFCAPIPRNPYPCKGCFQPIVTPTLSAFLSR